MYLYLYNFTKKFNSTKKPEIGDHRTVEVTLKAPTDMMRPSFVLKRSDLLDANYIEWVQEDLSDRFYRITDRVVMTNDLMQISCELDVLATYRAYAGTEQYLLRSSNATAYAEGNEIPDSLYPVLPYEVTGSIKAPTEGPALTNTNGFYVLGFTSAAPTDWTIAGLADHRGSIGYFIMTQAQMFSFMSGLLKLTGAESDISPMSYISSMIYIPFQPTIATGSVITFTTQVFGASFSFDYTAANFVTPTITRGIMHTSDTDFDIVLHPDSATRGNRMNLEPFTSIVFHGGPYGDIPIPNDIFYNAYEPELIIKQTIDVCSGVGLLQFYNRYNGHEFMRSNGQIGINIRISQISTRSKAQDLSLMAGLANAFGKTMVQTATGDLLGAVSTSAAALGDTLMGIYTGGLPKVSSSGNNDSIIDYESCWNLQFIFRKATPEYLSEMGRPVFKIMDISQHPGYTKCLNAEIEDFPGTMEEYNILIGYMNTGFHYE